MNRLRYWAGATLVALACFAALPARAEGPVKVKLMYTAVSAYLSAFVAKDQGFFARHGLDVELVPAANGSIIIASIVSGSVQIGTPTPSVFLQAVDAGIDQVALAATNVFPDNGTKSGVLVRNGGGIDAPKDLVGKKVGVPGIGGLLDVIFRKWLTEKGVDPRKVTFVETSFPQMSDLLKSGQVDAVVGVDPFYTRIIQQKTGHLLDDYTKIIPDGAVASVFSATGRWAKANPAAVKGFQTAIAEAVDFAKKNPDAARASVARYTKLPPPVVKTLAIPNLAAKMSSHQLDFWIAVCKEQGLIRGHIDPAKLVVPWTAAS